MKHRGTGIRLSMAAAVLLVAGAAASGLSGAVGMLSPASPDLPTCPVPVPAAPPPVAAPVAAPPPVAAPTPVAAPSAEPAPAPAASFARESAPEPAGDHEWKQEVFREWVAFGSGCRARSGEPGDVTMERRTLRSGGRVIHRARFHLDHYRLTTEDRPDGEPLDFARECAIRVQLVPPPGERIARVTARTRVASTKSESARLTVLGELKLGPASLGRKLVVHGPGEALDGREDVFRLAPGAEEAFPRLACAQSKLVGFDATWLAERPAAADQVFVELSGDRVLDLDAELSDCE